MYDNIFQEIYIVTNTTPHRSRIRATQVEGGGSKTGPLGQQLHVNN